MEPPPAPKTDQAEKAAVGAWRGAEFRGPGGTEATHEGFNRRLLRCGFLIFMGDWVLV